MDKFGLPIGSETDAMMLLSLVLCVPALFMGYIALCDFDLPEIVYLGMGLIITLTGILSVFPAMILLAWLIRM
ncbi:MAG TPA: hypothetical protein ENJ00_07540 [Phycisphaerales bacterium]|nr:hypothetical protein [Phycisphaerales bacterium]